VKNPSYRDDKRPAKKSARQNSSKENMQKELGLNKLAFILSAFSIGAAVLVSTFSYQKTINDTLTQYYNFYSQIAGMIALNIGTHSNMSDNEILHSLESEWNTIKNRPSDEHLCIVNEDSKLLLHTSVPSSVGSIVDHNLLLDKTEQKYGSLGDLVKTQKEYVGGYISSSGDAQIAAFAPVPQKKWVVGVHRSKEALLKEINSGLKPVFFSLIIISGILIPISLALLYWSFIICYRKSLRAEKAFTDSEHSYHTIVDGTDDLITQVDANGLFTFVNHTSNKIWGLSPEECVGLSAFNFIHPEDQEKTKKAFEGWITQKKKHITYQNRQVNKNGQIFEMHWTINLEFNESGEVLRILNIAHDITERKKAEQEIADLNKNLEELVKERTITLEAVNAELDAFNYSVSHDLRAPIRSMEGFSKILLKNNENTLNDESKDHLNRIIKGAARMKDLVDSLLEISRISRRNLVKSKINISDLATNILKTLRSDHPEHTIEVVIEKGLFFYGDKKLLNIALENLIDNAWKFTSKVTDPRIEIGSIRPENEAIFFIKDNGCGFDMGYADKIFIAFQRLHKENEYPGLGIGLATVKRIMNLHGSKIWVESELNKGTTFYFKPIGT